MKNKKEKSREQVIVATSGLGIIVNVLLASAKIIFGLITSSIAVISEGVNNATDCASSVITMVGAKLSEKKPTEKHPFGYGRIEYITSMIISVIILYTAIELVKSSVGLIFNPEFPSITLISIIVIVVSAVVKLLLSIYTISQGKKVGANSLVAIGVDCRNDFFISLFTILSMAIVYFLGFSIDAYAGLIISVFVLKAGLSIMIETIGDLLGRSADKELADKLYKIIRSTKGVLNAADMMLHNYGPDEYSGSVNIEIDHEKTIGEMYAIIHELQLKIMHDYGITMVFGMYAVDTDHQEVKELRKCISDFVKKEEHVLSYHALYISPDTNDIYCDLVVDFKLSDRDKLDEDFKNYMATLYPDRKINLTIETDYV